jgi:(S)-2-hydroxyglutarate dehydrogenase
MSRQGLRIRTNHDPIEAGYVVNAAGLYTDKIAMGCGFSKHYRVLPFKGLYLYSNESPDSIRCNIPSA